MITKFSFTHILPKFFLLTPLLLLAASVNAQEQAAGPSTFANSPTLWTAIVIGLIASSITLRYAMNMKGSRVGGILGYLGAGMFFVVLGFLSVAVVWIDSEFMQKLVHDFLFIIGYVLMLLGALKIRHLGV